MRKKTPGCIRLRGVRQNNLKNIDLDVPLRHLVVISGLSGSGKSSLAFETLFAEGQRRYIETFSPYARQFFDRMDKPQAHRIEGIPPAIAIEQRNSVKSTRSTVGTMTEIADYAKVFWAQLARLHCRRCGQPVAQEPPQKNLAGHARAGGGGGNADHVPLDLSGKFSLEESLALVARQGYQRLLLDGEVVRVGRVAAAAERFAARPADRGSGPGEVEGVQPGAIYRGLRAGVSFWAGQIGGPRAFGKRGGFGSQSFFKPVALRGRATWSIASRRRPCSVSIIRSGPARRARVLGGSSP